MNREKYLGLFLLSPASVLAESPATISKGWGNALVRYDTGVTSYSKNGQVLGKPNATARLFIYQPDKNGVDETAVKLDAQGQATVNAEGIPNQVES